MIKICHIADIHLGFRKYTKVNKLGVNQREADVSLSFKETVDRVVQLKPDLVIVAGDLFHQVRPTNTILTLAFRELRRLSLAAPVVIVSGNHETPKRSDSGNILKLFEEIPGIFVADNDKQEFEFPQQSLSITALPHAGISKDFAKLRANDNYRYNVLVAHGQIGDNWISDYGGVEKNLTELSANEFDYVALGHIHVFKQVGMNAWFSGAIDHTSSNIWSESEQPKGFIEVALSKENEAGQIKADVKFHSLRSPREVLVLSSINAATVTSPEELQEKILNSLENVSGGVDGKIMRLEVKDIPKEIFRQINHKLFKEYRARALHLQLELKLETPTNMVSVNAQNLQAKPLLEQLEQFTNEYKKSSPTKPGPIVELYQEYFQKLMQAEEGHEIKVGKIQ